MGFFLDLNCWIKQKRKLEAIWANTFTFKTVSYSSTSLNYFLICFTILTVDCEWALCSDSILVSRRLVSSSSSWMFSVCFFCISNFSCSISATAACNWTGREKLQIRHWFILLALSLDTTRPDETVRIFLLRHSFSTEQ